MTDKLLEVSKFERGMDSANHSEISRDKLLFPIASNIHYRYESADYLLENLDVLAKVIMHHYQYQAPRLQVLDDYYKGRNTALFESVRRLNDNKSDHRIAHNFAKIITQFKTGYTTGNPIKIVADEDGITKSIVEFDTNNEIDALNTELMIDVSKYGRAYDIQYRRDDDTNAIALSNVFETFVIYDTSIERKPIMAVRYTTDSLEATSDEVTITLYTANKIYTCKPATINSTTLEIDTEELHFYKEVPITEYANNRFRMGDYEDLLSLFDAYDQATSDTANHLTDTINSLLVISGDFSTGGLRADELMRQIKEYNLLGLKSGTDREGKQTNLTARYISPELNVQDAEVYKDRIRKDIFSLSNVPDMSDQNFSGNSSGEAMKYKLFGFEQAIAATQRVFKKSLMRRYRLLFNLKNTIKESQSRIGKLTVTFVPNMPKAVSEELDMLTKSGTPVSNLTKLGLASFIDDPKAELERVEQQEEVTSNVPSVDDYDASQSKTVETIDVQKEE